MENRCKALVLSLPEDFCNILSSCIFEFKRTRSLERQNKTRPAFASRTGMRGAATRFGSCIEEGLAEPWGESRERSWVALTHFSTPPARLCSPCPLRPIGALGKDVTISPHVSRVLPGVSKVLFPGRYFRRKIAFHSQIRNWGARVLSPCCGNPP